MGIGGSNSVCCVEKPIVNLWLYFLLEKYGVVPKKYFPESHTTEATRRMNEILNHKVKLT